MKVFEISEEEYEQGLVPYDGTPGALVVVRRKNGERRLLRLPEPSRHPQIALA